MKFKKIRAFGAFVRQALLKVLGVAVLVAHTLLFSTLVQANDGATQVETENPTTDVTQTGTTPTPCPPETTTPCGDDADEDEDLTTTQDSFQPSFHAGNPVNLTSAQ